MDAFVNAVVVATTIAAFVYLVVVVAKPEKF